MIELELLQDNFQQDFIPKLKDAMPQDAQLDIFVNNAGI